MATIQLHWREKLNGRSHRPNGRCRQAAKPAGVLKHRCHCQTDLTPPGSDTISLELTISGITRMFEGRQAVNPVAQIFPIHQLL